MPSKRTPLTIKNYSVTNEQKSIAVWLIKKYTSYAWIKRTKQALEIFTNGYEDYVSKKGAIPWRREVLSGLRDSLSAYVDGLERIEKGNYLKGREFVLEGTAFTNWLEEPRSEITDRHIEIGYRVPPKKSVGLYSYGSLALEMAYRTKISFTGAQKIPEILDNAVLPDDILDRVEPFAPLSTEILDFEDEISVTGIWIPINHPFACPQYLKAGRTQVEIAVPAMEVIQWSNELNMLNGAKPDRRFCYYDEIPGKFILHWQEARYPGGKIPDESGYLDSTVTLPEDALGIIPVKDEDHF